ncbi:MULTISPECIES: MarR family winged helix-turn-helix transcriptional regulator [Comamonas]|uniref:Putative aminophenol repressor n=1 Tax=Comamonas testosteroni CNB-1 TaxID=543891 RepID=Q38M43_COMTE|nr:MULTISPECIES: MarR family transcriptional regulator [Comamonas]ABB13575.1 putative aminophenol repressor [Comamonas testosteroni CNB-1]
MTAEQPYSPIATPPLTKTNTPPAKAKPAGQPADASDLLTPEARRILDNFRLEDVASHLLRRAHFAAEEVFSREFARESLTPRQKAALVVVYQQPGLNQNALAERLFMDRNTVAEMVKRLVAAGLVRRASGKGDQRAYEFFLAPEGAMLLNRRGNAAEPRHAAGYGCRATPP